MRRLSACLAALTALAACEALIDFDGLDYSADTRTSDGGNLLGGGGSGMGGLGGALSGGMGPGGSSTGGRAAGGQGAGGNNEGACDASPGPEGCALNEPCDTCSSGICSIQCPGPFCGGQTITCPVGLTCFVNCIGVAACANKTVFCPVGHFCKLACAADSSCSGTQLHCPDTARCQMDCANQPNVCANGAQMHCGPKDCTANCFMHSDGPLLDCMATGCGCDSCNSGGAGGA